MARFTRLVLIGTAANLAITSSASANNYLFRGDCSVARQYQENVSFREIFAQATYRGFQGRKQKQGDCFVDIARFYDLSNPRFTQGKVVFTLRETSKNVGSSAPACASTSFKTATGTATFELRRFNVSGKCEIRIQTKFNFTYSGSTNSVESLGYLALLNDYSFTVTRPDLTSNGLYATPVAFTAVGRR